MQAQDKREGLASKQRGRPRPQWKSWLQRSTQTRLLITSQLTKGKKHKKVRVDLSVEYEEVRVDWMSVVSCGCRRKGPHSSAREKHPESRVFYLPNLLQINVLISSKVLIWLLIHLTVLSSHDSQWPECFLQMNSSYLLSPCLQNNIFKKADGCRGHVLLRSSKALKITVTPA